MLSSSLRVRIFLALLTVVLPLFGLLMSNYLSVLSVIRQSPGYQEATGSVLMELVDVESRAERLSAALRSESYPGPSFGNEQVSELRISLSIVENLVGDRPSTRRKLAKTITLLDRISSLVNQCGASCPELYRELITAHELFDKSVEDLMRYKVGNIISSYRTLKSQIEAGNNRNIWAVIILTTMLLLTSYLLASRLTAQISGLDRATQALSRGELDHPLPSPSNDEIGRLISSFNTLRDNLQSSTVTRRYLETLLERLGEGVIVTNLLGTVEAINTSAMALFQSGHKLTPGDTFDPSTYGVSPDFYGSVWVTLRSASEQERRLVITRALIRDERDHPRGFVYGIRDTTEQWKLEQSVHNHRDTLIRTERIMALGTLGAIVAHKLSQPISSTKLFLQQSIREAKKSSTSDGLSNTLKLALSEVTRIADTVSQMMHTRRQSAIVPSELCAADASKAVESVMSTISDIAQRSQASIVTELPKEFPKLRCRDLELEEMLYCLLNNALQARMPGRSTAITLRLEQDTQFGRITVTDNCSGIPEADLDSIFDCFFTTKGEGEGSGIGLAIVKHIAESHGGKVEVRSDEGNGSVFTILLPIVEETYEPEAPHLHS